MDHIKVAETFLVTQSSILPFNSQPANSTLRLLLAVLYIQPVVLSLLYSGGSRQGMAQLLKCP